MEDWSLAKKASSLKAEFRTRLLKEVRARGHSCGNIWYVFSIKMNADMVLPSDQALIYWVVFLETDTEVISFNQGQASDNYDFFVERKSGLQSRVSIGVSTHRPDDRENIIIIPRQQVELHASLAISLMKVLSFGAAIREGKYTAAANAVRAVEVSLEKGDVQALFDNTPLLSNSVVCGVLARHWIEGLIEMDFSCRSTFGRHTQWRCKS